MTSWWLGQQKEMGYTLPCRATCATSGRYGHWVNKVPSIACVSRRDRHRWPETLPSLVASLPLKEAQSGQCSRGEKLNSPGCHVLAATSWLHFGLPGSKCFKAQILRLYWPADSQRVSGMTVLRSPSASCLTSSSPDRTVSLLASRELLVGEGAFLWINPTVIW